MLETIGRLANRVADYTIGTVIVLVHVTMADRRGRPRLPQSTQDPYTNDLRTSRFQHVGRA
jgi:hypothetical protein